MGGLLVRLHRTGVGSTPLDKHTAVRTLQYIRRIEQRRTQACLSKMPRCMRYMTFGALGCRAADGRDVMRRVAFYASTIHDLGLAYFLFVLKRANAFWPAYRATNYLAPLSFA